MNHGKYLIDERVTKIVTTTWHHSCYNKMMNYFEIADAELEDWWKVGGMDGLILAAICKLANCADFHSFFSGINKDRMLRALRAIIELNQVKLPNITIST